MHSLTRSRLYIACSRFASLLIWVTFWPYPIMALLLSMFSDESDSLLSGGMLVARIESENSCPGLKMPCDSSSWQAMLD